MRQKFAQILECSKLGTKRCLKRNFNYVISFFLFTNQEQINSIYLFSFHYL